MDSDTYLYSPMIILIIKKIKINNELSCYSMTHYLLMNAEHTNIMLTNNFSGIVKQQNEELRLSKYEAQKSKGNLYIHVSFPFMKLY